MLSAALAAVELSRGAASAVAVAPLADSTIQGAMAFAARPTPATSGVTELAAVVARDVSRSMGLAKLKMVAGLILTTSLLTAGWLAHRTVPDAPSAPSPSANRGGLAALVKVDPNEEGRLRAPADAPIEVRGRVLDPRGKPFAGARLYVGYTPRRYEPESIAHQPVYPLRATSGTDGRFRFVFTRSQLDERYLDASRPVVMAAADGFGVDWSEIGERAAGAFLNLRLVEDRPVEGRVLDANGKPVAGATVFVREMSSETPVGLARSVERFDRGSEPFKRCLGPLPGQPRVTTAADGRFRLPGVGRDRIVTLALGGPAIPATTCMAATRPAAEVASKLIHGGPFDVTLPAAQSIRGVVRDKATGAPLAGVKMSAASFALKVFSTTYTDKDGCYELQSQSLPGPKGHVVVAQPQKEQPFFTAEKGLPDMPGALYSALRLGDEYLLTAEKGLPDKPGPLRADFALIRGIPLRGRVTVQTNAKPPKKALLEYYPLFPNPHIAALTERHRLLAASSATLQPDGSYHLTVLPGPGVVLVRASPRDSYASALLDDKELANLFHDGLDHGGGSWIHIAGAAGADPRCVDRYNALSLIEPDERVKSLTLDFTVQAAIPLRGTVVGPEGEACAGVRVSGLTSMPDAETLESASFLVEGLNPRRPRTLSFHDRENGLGKVVTLRGDEASPLTVQLEPCGVVMGRMVDKDGKPVSGVEILFGRDDKGLDARAESDHWGQFRAALVPGLRYQFGLLSARRLLKRVDPVEVESGQTKDLGDVPLGD
jgi:protocatechuate 3,4-dioxygenase beta subunit